MAREVIWSWRAQNDKKAILAYWKNRNKSNSYSKKLNGLFREAIRLIQEHPKVGRPTDDESVRVKIVRDYLVIYELSDTAIEILTIWDVRQDPQKLKDII